jgi:hypothetical protein
MRSASRRHIARKGETVEGTVEGKKHLREHAVMYSVSLADVAGLSMTVKPDGADSHFTAPGQATRCPVFPTPPLQG